MDIGDTGGGDRPRRRDAAATRNDLLTAARRLIAEHGVEGTSTRDVATAAGVNQALVYRYFGSKEKLFAEAVGGTSTEADEIVAYTPVVDIAWTMLRHALSISVDIERHPSSISALVTGANDETIRAILKQRIEHTFGDGLAGRLDGPDGELRAELLAALITGIGFLREKVGTSALARADPDTLADYVDRMTKPLFTDDFVPAGAHSED